MAINIDAKFEEKLTCAFKNDMRNLANSHQSMFENLKIRTFIGSFYPKQNIFVHRLKNSDFVLESKKAELNQNKNSKQTDRPDAV